MAYDRASFIAGLTMGIAMRGGRHKPALTPTVLPYLTFSSPNSFTLGISNSTKNWDGTLEWSIDTNTWTEWNGASVISSALAVEKYTLYLRGVGNTKITGAFAKRFILTGNAISVDGDIRNLLDYNNVEQTVMARYCFSYLFLSCTALISAPSLPATTLASNCYASMFYECTSLVAAPELPATTLASNCYDYMFYGCTSLVVAPELPATTLAAYCYAHMFYSCASLVVAPELPATTLADFCYIDMFHGCTSLVAAPELPAMTLVYSCYNYMFYGCTSLVVAPKLPATTLAAYCYSAMFRGCTSLETPPQLPASVMVSHCYHSMFRDCIQLKVLPSLDNAKAVGKISSSFETMFAGCTQIKISEGRVTGFNTLYFNSPQILGTNGGAAYEMFSNTGGPFTGTPKNLKQYYTSNAVI